MANSERPTQLNSTEYKMLDTYRREIAVALQGAL